MGCPAQFENRAPCEAPSREPKGVVGVPKIAAPRGESPRAPGHVIRRFGAGVQQPGLRDVISWSMMDASF
jgi:hypothetical protein